MEQRVDQIRQQAVKSVDQNHVHHRNRENAEAKPTFPIRTELEKSSSVGSTSQSHLFGNGGATGFGSKWLPFCPCHQPSPPFKSQQLHSSLNRKLDTKQKETHKRQSSMRLQELDHITLLSSFRIRQRLSKISKT